MTSECEVLLQWALPRMGLAWSGFRRVRRQVCRRIGRRMQELRLADVAAYRRRLEGTPEEWAVLEQCCRITISRFFRDRVVFEHLSRNLLPELAARAAAQGRRVRAWSAGCASGEEPYSLGILWRLGLEPRSATGLEILATDIDPDLLERARQARYPSSSLREVPSAWRALAFQPDPPGIRLRPEFQEGVTFLLQDLRREKPPGQFDLILCRNLAFTYFDAEGQRAMLDRFFSVLWPHGALVTGRNETLPAEGRPFTLRAGAPGIYSLPALQIASAV